MDKHTGQDSLPEGRKGNGAVVGAVVGVLMFFLLVAVAVVSAVLLLVFFSRRRKRKNFQRMQQDILAVYVSQCL